MTDQPEWHSNGAHAELVYRGYALVSVTPEEPGVRVRTRCYSEGYQQNRLMATVNGGIRYGDAWLRKWGADAMRDINNKLLWSAGEAERRKELEARRGAHEPSLTVPKYRARKRRR